MTNNTIQPVKCGTQWPSNRFLNSELSCPGFRFHRHRVVPLSKTNLLLKVLVKAQEATSPQHEPYHEKTNILHM